MNCLSLYILTDIFTVKEGDNFCGIFLYICSAYNIVPLRFIANVETFSVIIHQIFF